MEIIGRVSEQKILTARLASAEAELIAIYGRRRVGKTFLVRTFCKDEVVFEFTGIHGATMKTQLENFSQTLQLATQANIALATPASWLQAFMMLDRQDRCINICEIKFSGSEFVINKKYVAELDTKVNVFRTETSTKKTSFSTIITTYGTLKNEYYLGRIQAEVVMEDLFT